MPRTIPAKSILSKVKNGPDPWFGITYNMNLYRGCQHQCIYCDSRSECYQLGDLSDIRIKENALAILERELKSKRQKGTVGFGSMNDPYMPVEKNDELVRSALKLLIKYNFPVHILTKSDLIIRDIDLLTQLSNTYTAASLTITTANDDLARIIEPAAPVSSMRLDAIRQLSKAGIYTGVMLMPILPFINDSWEEIEELIHRSKEAGAKYLLFWPGMTLRKGSRDYFYTKLDQHFPGIKEKYISSFGESYTCNSLNSNNLYSKASELCNKLFLPVKMNFHNIPSTNQLELNF
jgi:DNA repair photolyase